MFLLKLLSKKTKKNSRKVVCLKRLEAKSLSTNLEGWFNKPKSVKLLDISIVSFIFILVISFAIYFTILDRTTQNLIFIFLTAILLFLTWNFRTQIAKTPDLSTQKRYFREWIIYSTIFIIIAVILVLIYPVTY